VEERKERNEMRTKVAVVASLGLFLVAAPVWAHHAFAAEFDSTKPIKLRGTITKVEFINPHAWIHIDVKDADGKMVNWMVEGGSPNALYRRGVTKDSLAVGTEVMVEGYLAKSGENKANGADVTFTDGRKLFLGSSNTGAPGEKPGK
jgi:hypothetical protein